MADSAGGKALKTAIVIGATGLTGRSILRHLVNCEEYDKILVFARRPLDRSDPKIEFHQVDFELLEDWQHLVKGDDLFSALGTTRKQAGSKDNQYRVDYTLQTGVIGAAAQNGTRRLFLVSSPHADTKSPFFYLRMKGELEIFSANQEFKTMVFFKPSIITGDRPDERPAEKLGAAISRRLGTLLPVARGLRPISGDDLGRAMVTCACTDLPIGLHIYEPRDIFDLLES